MVMTLSEARFILFNHDAFAPEQADYAARVIIRHCDRAGDAAIYAARAYLEMRDQPRWHAMAESLAAEFS